jgi:tryprostatin B 6-hydroxylase
LISDSIRNDSVEKDENLLTGEAVVGIIAGRFVIPWFAAIKTILILCSDTTGPTLTMVFYQLAKHPEHQAKLYDELQRIDVTDPEALKSFRHLNAIIDETMRCHPAIMTGGNRDTPPEGMTIAGRFIPGNVTIVSPRYSIFRCEL